MSRGQNQPSMVGEFISREEKVLGGSSTINGMIFIRGNPMDFDGWARLPIGWSPGAMPMFCRILKRLENRRIGGDDYRGDSGPLHLETPDCDNPLFEAFFQAAEEAGYPRTDDVNGYQQEGFGRFDRDMAKSPMECGPSLFASGSQATELRRSLWRTGSAHCV